MIYTDGELAKGLERVAELAREAEQARASTKAAELRAVLERVREADEHTCDDDGYEW